MSEFTAGFAGRHQVAAQLLQQAFAAAPAAAFAPADLSHWTAAAAPHHFAPEEAQPRHFAPADPDANPTEGWDPFQAAAGAPLDPLVAAHARGFAEGMTAAGDDVRAAAERDQAMLAQLADALRSDARIDRAEIARRLRQTVLHLVQRIVGEVGIAPDLLAARIENAAELLADSAESALIRVHPADVPLLEGRLPATVFAVGDAHVARGGFVLESATTLVEDGPDLWLEQLAQAIDRAPVPPGC